MTVFKHKTILGTGAASGIGRETAIAFAEKGANVSISDVDIHGLLETAKLMDETILMYGMQDGTYNNAGADGELDATGYYKVKEEASFITGHKLPVNGGYSAS